MFLKSEALAIISLVCRVNISRPAAGIFPQSCIHTPVQNVVSPHKTTDLMILQNMLIVLW